MEKLKSMTDFVLEQMENVMLDGTGVVCAKIGNHANFLFQTLNISMFVPAKLVDGVWVVLEEPEENDLNGSFFKMQTNYHEEQEYETAKSNVLFEGFEVCHRNEGFDCIVNGDFHLSTNFKYEKTIEDLVKYHLTLTTTAKKQIGL